MATIPGTYFTKEQLEAALKVDKVSARLYTGLWRMTNIGYIYGGKEQYDKALAWYILAARGNNSTSQSNIGILYFFGKGVPKNYLCALKWFLKSVEQNEYKETPNFIGKVFEGGFGVPLDNYKALEWYCHGRNKTHRDKMKSQGYHRSETDKYKPLEELRNETEVILDAEKKKLEQKQHKTQQDVETLEQLKITYKLVDGGKDAWKSVPILLATSKQRDTKPGNSSVTNTQNEILELKKQIQLLTQDKDIFQIQANQLQQETTKLELQIKENDKELISLRNDNQSLKHSIDECEQQIKIKDNKINLLESEKHDYHSTSIYQNQILNSLKQDNKTMEQDKVTTTNEMERLKASYATLEKLLKSKEDVIASLNRENQGNQQGTNIMVETLNNLLQAKTNEMELQRQNMELLLANEKRRIEALEQENGSLKQENRSLKQEKPQQDNPQQQTAVQNTGPVNNNTSPTNSDPSHHDQHDDSYNDINYETEYSDTDDSGGDDINYDTPSEDEDTNNDLNYDDPK